MFQRDLLHMEQTREEEVLIDADVFQHCLYNPKFEVKIHEKDRYEKLKLEFGIV